MTGKIVEENSTEVEVSPSRWANLKAKTSARAVWLESRFLSLLRYGSLAIAALFLLGAIVLFSFGLARQIGNTNVKAESVTLAASDVTPLKAEAKSKTKEVAPAKPTLGDGARKRTLEIYRARFKPSKRADDKIKDEEIVDYVWSEDRLTAYDNLGGRLKDSEGKPLLGRDEVALHALGVIDTSVQNEDFRKQLAAYRDAKKVSVCNEEVKTRSRTFASWDSTATYCPNWYTAPVGCASTSTVDEPYVTKVCEMKFPADLESPAEQLASAVERYAVTASARLEAAENDALAKSAQNMEKKVEGMGNIGTSGQLMLAFMAIMFLYLFVAMERHHRSLRQMIAKAED